ncbi:two-component response regulator-like APRR7 [Abrus precatorius]|uniref:Two-component response regulator-like APRR7 n=1 Tax=Abrus precatorius TaxID=3816 RepID=A0A8B8KTE9_ABRPR|nr:two-component response regulator-like APRR7 [Abrus precatorius]
MCNNNTPSSDIQTSSIMKRTRKPTIRFSSSSSSSSLKPLRRRNRTKTRKPKFVSLRLKLSQPKKMAQPKAQQQQLNLFPLHPEDKDMHEENNVALLFSSDGGATLTGLLEDESTTTTATATSEEGSLSPMTCPAVDGNWLVRKAMRKRERESEERWVCYSEVVEEKKETMEEVTSYCDTLAGAGTTTSFGLLSLKLDHEGILNAWSDKGSLYVADEEAPQAVPDLLNGLPLHNALVPNVAWDSWGSEAGNIWKVPEDCGANKMVKEETGGWKVGQREASVQRYKEKRQSRLFSKRIRYEVRKLNAEKRPRMKGRFVKRE